MNFSEKLIRDGKRACGSVFLAATVLSGAGFAHAVCGDDVDGQRVPCGCGDIVVSDARLREDDPVIRERCSGDGLLVRATPGSESLVLDLSGFSIVGFGRGAGVRILDGGSRGAIVVGGPDGQPGTIAGFGTGLRATGPGSLQAVRNLTVKGNTFDGLVLRGSGTSLEDVVAERNGRDGLRLGGRDVELRNVQADSNRRSGVRVTGREIHGSYVARGNGVSDASISNRTITVTPESEEIGGE